MLRHIVVNGIAGDARNSKARILSHSAHAKA